VFLKDGGMADEAKAAAPVTPMAWDEDLIFATLGDPVRRRLLVALAVHGPQPGVTLKDEVGRRLSATLKHLVSLRDSGLVVMRDNPRDGRRQLYALAPTVPVTRTETDVLVDFGFCAVRLKTQDK